MSSSILVLEDDTNLREIIVESLEDEGFRVKSAGDPDAAIQLAQKNHFELALSDIRMAGSTDGLGALEAIKKFQPRLRTIVMTGFASLDAPGRAAHLAADDYLLKGDKSFGVAELLRVVRSVLERDELAPLSWWQRLLAAPARALQKSAESSLLVKLPPLEEKRKAVFSFLYLYIRSNHIPVDIFWKYFQMLLVLETEYLDLDRVEKIAPLQTLYQHLIDSLKTSTIPTLQSHPHGLTQEQVYRLYERVRQGLIDGWQFEQATSLWLKPDSRRESPSSYVLYHVLWGVDANYDPKFYVGKTLGSSERVLVTRRIATVGDVQRYEGKLEKDCGSVIVEMVTRTPDSDDFSSQALSNPETIAVENLPAHLMVVRRGDGSGGKLESLLRGAPIHKDKVLAFLAPVFGEVIAGHRQNLADGCLGAHRIYLTAFGGRLDMFGPTRFNTMLSPDPALNLVSFGQLAHLAPEIRSAPESIEARRHTLRPSADQYCLGSIFTQMLLGLPSRQYLSELLEAPKSHLGGPDFALSQRWPQAAPTEAILHQMMAKDPSARFPSVEEALRRLRAL